MKKLMIMLVAMVVSFNAFTMKAEAGCRTNQNNRKFEQMYNELCEGFAEDYELKDEEQKKNLDYEISYKELGYGLYDIFVVFTLYDEDVVEAHIIYDIVIDEECTSFAIIDGERYEFEYVNELYPEFN